VTEVRVPQVRAAQACPSHIRIPQVCTHKSSALQVRTKKRAVSKARGTKVGLSRLKLRVEARLEFSPLKISSGEVRTVELHFGHFGTTELGAH
jgi:hypothetical protein